MKYCAYCGLLKPEVVHSGDVCNGCYDEARRDPDFPDDSDVTQDSPLDT